MEQQDYRLWKYDIQHRFSPSSLVHNQVGDNYIATSVISAVTKNSTGRMSLLDAYFDLRCKLLKMSVTESIGILPRCTTAELALLNDIVDGQSAINITTGLYARYDKSVEAWLSTDSGTVFGPASATDNALARYNGAGGASIQSSAAILDNAGKLSGLTELIVVGLIAANTGTPTAITNTAGGAIIVTGSSPSIMFEDTTELVGNRVMRAIYNSSNLVFASLTSDGTSIDVDNILVLNRDGIVTINNQLIVNDKLTGDELDIDNINIKGNTISTTDDDGDLFLSPDGDGDIVLEGDVELDLKDVLTLGTDADGLMIDNSITYEDGITASTIQTQAAGTLITKDLTTIGTVANTGDALTLPAAVSGKIKRVDNSGANSCRIFPASGNKFKGLATDAGLLMGNQAFITFFCTDGNEWKFS